MLLWLIFKSAVYSSHLDLHAQCSGSAWKQRAALCSCHGEVLRDHVQMRHSASVCIIIVIDSASLGVGAGPMVNYRQSQLWFLTASVPDTGKIGKPKHHNAIAKWMLTHTVLSKVSNTEAQIKTHTRLKITLVLLCCVFFRVHPFFKEQTGNTLTNYERNEIWSSR